MSTISDDYNIARPLNSPIHLAIITVLSTLLGLALIYNMAEGDDLSDYRPNFINAVIAPLIIIGPGIYLRYMSKKISKFGFMKSYIFQFIISFIGFYITPFVWGIKLDDGHIYNLIFIVYPQPFLFSAFFCGIMAVFFCWVQENYSQDHMTNTAMFEQHIEWVERELSEEPAPLIEKTLRKIPISVLNIFRKRLFLIRFIFDITIATFLIMIFLTYAILIENFLGVQFARKYSGYFFGPGIILFFFSLGVNITVGVSRKSLGHDPVAEPVPNHSIVDRFLSDRPLLPGDPDPLGFGRLANGISMFIRNSQTQPPLTIALQGEWGTGKSSVMNLIMGRLRSEGWRTSTWFNAWHHQQEDHLLASLIETITISGLPPFWTRG